MTQNTNQITQSLGQWTQVATLSNKVHGTGPESLTENTPQQREGQGKCSHTQQMPQTRDLPPQTIPEEIDFSTTAPDLTKNNVSVDATQTALNKHPENVQVETEEWRNVQRTRRHPAERNRVTNTLPITKESCFTALETGELNSLVYTDYKRIRVKSASEKYNFFYRSKCGQKVRKQSMQQATHYLRGICHLGQILKHTTSTKLKAIKAANTTDLSQETNRLQHHLWLLRMARKKQSSEHNISATPMHNQGFLADVQ